MPFYGHLEGSYKKMKNMKKLIIFSLFFLSACGFFEENGQDDVIIDNIVLVEHVEPPQEIEFLPAHGGSISISSRRPETLNPITNRDESVNEVLGLIFESLFVLIDGQMQPILAQSLQQTETNSAILTLKNARWENGTQVTTEDVAFTINQIRSNPNSLFSVSSIMNYQIIDDRQMQINFTPNIDFLDYELNFPIISRSYYQNRMNNGTLLPMGSGPFRIEEQTSRRIVLTRNPNYRYNIYLSYIEVIITPDRETDFNAFLGSVVTTLTTDMLELSHHGVSSVQFNTSSIFTYYLDFLAFNPSNFHLADIRVREAIGAAFPFNLVHNVYQGQITRTSSFVHQNSRQYVENLYYREHDLNQSLEKFLSAGFTLENEVLGNALEIFIPLKFRILVNEENTFKMSLANSLRVNLENLGIEIELIALPFNDFYEQIGEGYFDILFATAELSNNFSPDFMEIFSYEAPDLSLDELQRHINSQIPMIAIGFRNDILLTHREIMGNIQPSPTNPFQNVHEWFVGIR